MRPKKLKLKFRDIIWIKWVDSDYSPDWEHYNKKTLLSESRNCQSIGMYLTQDKEVIAFCQSSAAFIATIRLWIYQSGHPNRVEKLWASTAQGLPSHWLSSHLGAHGQCLGSFYQ